MLSRVAGALYRLGRLVERADHLARVVDVHITLVLDRGREPESDFWPHVLELAGLDRTRDIDYRTALSAAVEGGPGSLRESIQRARGEAMAVRPSLSSEAYEGLNELYWTLDATISEANFHDFSVRVQRGVVLLYGLVDETMAHDEAWEFLRLGRQLERARSVVRLATRKLDWLNRGDDAVEWAAVLRSCTAFEAYRWRFSDAITALRVAEFVLLDQTLPHSARRAVAEALAGVHRIDGPGTRSGPYRLLGRLSALFEYTDAREVVDDPSGFSRAYLSAAAHVEDSLSATYFRPTRVPLGQPAVAPPIWNSSEQSNQQQ
jgi:uncharacterized alpha-E superfamily protein